MTAPQSDISPAGAGVRRLMRHVGGRTVHGPVDLELQAGSRLALRGPNRSGLLAAERGELARALASAERAARRMRVLMPFEPARTLLVKGRIEWQARPLAPRKAKRVRVTYKVTARDEVDGVIAADCRPRSGSTFKHGRTTVQCSAVDSSVNQREASFRVTVK